VTQAVRQDRKERARLARAPGREGGFVSPGVGAALTRAKIQQVQERYKKNPGSRLESPFAATVDAALPGAVALEIVMRDRPVRRDRG
jgi:hypothetical protein